MDKPSEHIQPPEDGLTAAQPAPRTVEYELTPEDIRAYFQYGTDHPEKPGGLQGRDSNLVLLGVLVLAIVIVPVTVRSMDNPQRWWDLVSPWNLLILLIGLLIMVSPWIVHRLNERYIALLLTSAERGGAFRRQTATLEADGFRLKSEQGETARNWDHFDKIVVHAALAMFFFHEKTAFLVPRRAFASDEAFQGFIETARQHHRRARPELYIRNAPGDEKKA